MGRDTCYVLLGSGNTWVNGWTAASPTKKEVDLFLEKGAHSILKKPVDPDELSEFIHKLESER